MKQTIEPEHGLTFKLDLQEGSRLYAPTPSRQARLLPISPHSYGYFVAGREHFTVRDQIRCLYQVFITHKGKGHFVLEDRSFVAEPNTVLLLDCGRPHRYESMDGVWEHEWVNFTGSACQVYYDLINPNGAIIHSLTGNREVAALLREVGDGMMQQDMVGFVHSSTRIIRLLDAIYSLVMEHQRNRMEDQRANIDRSVTYIEDHYMDRLTLDRLAQVAFLSKYYYTRAFSKYVGMTPYEYLTTVRLSHARTLLFTTQMSVEEIGWRVGFQGSRNLIRQFKKATGMTPGEYRRKGAGWESGYSG